MTISTFQGHQSFRQRIVLSLLTGKTIAIQNIRSSDEEHPGLLDFEASFLRLIEKVTNGSQIEINYTGTSVTFKPGVMIGGTITHDCPVSRAIGYFLEPMVALAPFGKYPLQLTLNGITNDNVDVSADYIRTVLLPQLKKFGISDDLQLKITKRGAPPLGGGQVTFTCPIVRSLNTIRVLEAGQIKRIRGIAYATRVSPQMANRVMEASRSLLTRYIPDVYIYTDVYKGPESGKSPGYALTLVAESTTECLLSAECAFQPRPYKGDSSEPSTENKELSNLESTPDTNLSSSPLLNDYQFPTPEDLGVRGARLLLQEIKKGGCADSLSQWIHVLFIALGPEDVGKIRLGSLSPFTIQMLRDIKTFFGTLFKIEPDSKTKTVLLTAVGTGYVNVNKKVA